MVAGAPGIRRKDPNKSQAEARKREWEPDDHGSSFPNVSTRANKPRLWQRRTVLEHSSHNCRELTEQSWIWDRKQKPPQMFECPGLRGAARMGTI